MVSKAILAVLLRTSVFEILAGLLVLELSAHTSFPSHGP